MKFEFAEWGWWSDDYISVVLFGVVDGKEFGLAFASEVLAEFFDVPKTPSRLQEVFNRNKALMEEISRDLVEAGKLGDDEFALVYRKDLLPYFERRAASARA